ncbi:MAG: beta-lactamase family protein [Flavobacteriales bacterium]|nr:beta-lactamase family protein [Flavobacteriales bacterium]
MKKITIVLLCFLTRFANAQEGVAYKVDSLVQNVVESNNIQGVSIGIVYDRKIIFTKGYGSLKKDSTLGGIKSTTPILSASTSKTFVATAIMQLQEKGLLKITDLLIKHLPQFEMKDKNYKQITIRQLLNHTSGFIEGSNYSWDKKKNKGKDIENFVLSLKRKSLLFLPGERFSYSNTGYVILGYLIERISKEPFSEYIKTKILDKCQMNSSSFDYFNFSKDSMPIYYNEKGKINDCCIGNTSPSGNLISTSTDLSKWIINNLKIYSDTNSIGTPLLTNRSLDSLWTPTVTFDGSRTTLGLGWWQYHSEEYGTSVFHSGHYDNYSVSNLVMFPEKQFGFVILCNTESAIDIVYNELSDGITEILNINWLQQDVKMH